MKVLRVVLTVAGGLVLAVGLALVAVPDAAAALHVADLVALLGNDYLLVVPLAVLAALAVIAVVQSRLLSGVDEASPPDPEGVPTAPHPGSEFDTLIDDGLGPIGRLFSDKADLIRERLRRTAIRTVMRADNCSRETARERIDRGEWTTDRGAVAFVTGDDGATGPGLVAVLRGASTFKREVRRTALAIAHYEEGPVYADGGDQADRDDAATEPDREDYADD